MTDITNEFPNWGETGELPPAGFFYSGGDQVNEKNLDALWHTLNEQFNEYRDGIERRVEDLSGRRVVDGLALTVDSAANANYTVGLGDAYAGGQRASVSSPKSLSSSLPSSGTRTDKVYLTPEGEANVAEGGSIPSEAILLYDITVSPSGIDSTTDRRTYVATATRAENEPNDLSDIWIDETNNVLKINQDGAYETIVTASTDVTINAGDGLGGGGTIPLDGGAATIDINVGDGLTVDGSDNLDISLGRGLGIDGAGNLRVNDVFVETDGDSMTGNLNMGSNSVLGAAKFGFNNGAFLVNSNNGAQLQFNGGGTLDMTPAAFQYQGNRVLTEADEGAGNNLDADTVDGQDYADIQNWVNNNADVPNADFADNAGDADTVDGFEASALRFNPSSPIDETANRQRGVQYINNSNEAKYVSIIVFHEESENFQFYVNGQKVYDRQSSPAGQYTSTVTGIVPSGDTYELQGSSTITIDKWTEQTL